MNETAYLVEALERLWANGSSPELDTFLRTAGTIDNSQLCRLARVDQAERWHRGDRRLAEEYLDRFPALRNDGESAVDLIYHEYLLRENRRECPSLEEFSQRFPQFATPLADQVQLHWAFANESNQEVPPSVAPTEKPVRDGSSTDNFVDGQTAERRSSNYPRRVGRYELLELVGAGSFGHVYRAKDSDLDRMVAVKIARRGNVSGTDDTERFLREARSAARLRHPSIVSIHEIGRFEQTPFLVSEFIAGTTLAEQIVNCRPVAQESAELVATLADALHYAHEMGVVHRDVKPANIILDNERRPKLMDFGLAKREIGDATVTFDGQLLGTPAYMSPEQARGESRSVDRRTDVYSLGVIFYQLLTGELPYRGSTQVLLHQVLFSEPPQPRSVSHLIPRDLETICMKAMSKEPPRRYATARDMADDLRRYLQSEPIHARPIGGAERLWRWCRRKPALAGMTAAAAVLLLAVAAGGPLAAFQFRRQAAEANSELYFNSIGFAHRELTASLPNPGRAEELLNACPHERRNWEWDYLKRLWRTEPAVLSVAGSGKFRGVAFSPDGRQLAAACGDGKIRIWDQVSGQMLVLPGHKGFVYSLAFSPVDSNRLVSSGNDGWVRIWDVASKQETLSRPLPGLKVYAVGMAYCVAISPDGKLIAAASEADTVQIWDADTGSLVHRLEGHTLQASCVAFSRNGRLLASGDWGGAVRIWDVLTGRLLNVLQLHEHRWPIACVAFSPDAASQYVAVGDFNRQVDVWDTARGTIHCRLVGHSGFITSLVFHPHDARRLVSAGEDRDVRIWDVPTGREILQLQGHIDNCSGLAFRPDGRLLASASYDQTIRMWDATILPDNQPHLLRTLDVGHEVWSVAISPDGTRIATASIEPDAQIWETTTGLPLRSFTASFSKGLFSLAFSPDGQRIAATGFDDGVPPTVLKVVDVLTGLPLLEHRERQEIFAVEFSPDGRRLAFGLADGTVKLSDAMTGHMIAVLGKHDDPIAYGGVRFRHDGMRLASASLDGMARIWDLTSVPSSALEQGASAKSSSLEPLLCRMTSGNPGIALFSTSYSPDGRYLITGDKDGQLRRWDAETGKELDTKREASRGAFLSVAFSPNGRWIVSASEDCTARVYDARTLELVQRFRGHLGPIRCLDVSKNFFVTGGTDNTVKVWSLKRLEAEAAGI